MAARDGDVVLGGIGADDISAKPRQRLAENAAAAADIENPQPGEAVEPRRIAAEMRGGAIANVGKAHRIELVQRRHGPARVPPLPGKAREPRDLFAVNGTGLGWLGVHGFASSLRASCERFWP